MNIYCTTVKSLTYFEFAFEHLKNKAQSLEYKIKHYFLYFGQIFYAVLLNTNSQRRTLHTYTNICTCDNTDCLVFVCLLPLITEQCIC